MIKSFRDQDAERLFQRLPSRRLPTKLHRAAWKKLAMLHAARSLQDLLVPPGNRLERLKRDRKGQYSVRINERWRVCFRWADGNATDVEVVDYH